MADSRVRGSATQTDNNAKHQRGGPRSLVLDRSDNGFGFTLRHFIVYPPESATLLGGCLSRAMDTIFVKRVAARSPAWRAGLCTGDRLVSVNGADVGAMSYAAVVQLIQAAPDRLHLVVVPKEHDILQLYFGETAHNPETNQRLSARRKSPEKLRLSAIPARVQGAGKPNHRLSSSADSARLSLDDNADNRPIADQRRSSDGNRRGAVYGNVAWGETYDSPCSDAYSASVDSRNDSLDSRLADSKDSLSSADSTSTLTGGDEDSLIMSRIRRSTEQKEEFLRRPVAATVHADRLPAREFYARPQKLKPVWPPTGPESARPHAPHRVPRRADAEGADTGRSSASPPQDNRPAVPLVALVSMRARHFERGADDERTPLYASELARLTTKRANPGVALRRREIERRSASREHQLQPLESCPESPPILSGNQLTPLTTRIHCEPPSANHDAAANETTNHNAPFTQRVNHASPLRVKTEDAFVRARSNSAESWAAALAPPRASLQACDWPLPHAGGATEADEARHKVVRQDSYLAAVRTPVPAADGLAAPRPTLLPLPPLPHLPSSPLTHTTTRQLISALDAAQGQAAGEVTTAVVRRQKNNHHAQTDEERLRRASYLRATNSEQTQLEQEIELEESEQRSANRKWRPPVFPDDIRQLREFFEEGARPLRHRESQPTVLPTSEPEKENVTAVREGWLNCKITVIDGKRCSDRSWKQVWAVLQPSRTLMLYKEPPTQGGADAEASSLDLRGCAVEAGAAVATRKKHALRVNTLSGSELLAQAQDTTEAEAWASALLAEPSSPSSCLSPASKSRKLPAFRSRSPSGQSPASKTAPAPGSPASKTAKGQSDGGISAGGGAKGKADKTATAVGSDAGPGKPRPDPTASPKTSTWKGRVARQLRRMQGAGPSSPNGVNAAAHGPGHTIGAALQDCAPSDGNLLVPMLVTKCAAFVEDRGLDIVGIYRVPGNTAAVHSLTEAVNKGFMFANCQDPRWTDVNVISSLLKLFFRKLPDALLTSELYPLFIDADKMEDPNLRIVTMRRLVRELPDHHYETLKFLCLHLKRVVAHSAANKMEARNLAIVFGPTLVRTAENDMITMVTDMSHQCRIVESLLLHVDWFFSPDSSETLELPAPGAAELEPSAMSHDLLIGNIQKVEGMLGGESSLAKAIGSSIISAANRKMQRKTRKSTTTAAGGGVADHEGREVSIDSAVRRHQMETDALRQATSPTREQPADEPANEQAALPDPGERLSAPATDAAASKAGDALGWTYAGLSATTQERIRRFEQETKAMLQRDPTWATRREIEPQNGANGVTTVSRSSTSHSSESRVSVTNIHVNPLASVENTESVTKRHQHEETSVRGEPGEVTGIALADTDNGNLKRFKTGNEQPCEPLRLMSSLRCASLDSLHDAFDRPPSELSDDGGCFVAWTRRLLAVNHKLARESRDGDGFWATLARLGGQPQAPSPRPPHPRGGRQRGAGGAGPAVDPVRGSDLLSSLTSTFDRKLKSLLGSTSQAATSTTLTSTSVTLPAPIRLSPVNLASLETLASHLVTLTAGSVTLPAKAAHDERTGESDSAPTSTTPTSTTLPSETQTSTTLTSTTLTLETLTSTTLTSTTLPSETLTSKSLPSGTLTSTTLTSTTLAPTAPATLTSPVAAATKLRSKIPTYRDPSLHRQTPEKDKEAIRRRWLGEGGDPDPAPRPETAPDCPPAPQQAPSPSQGTSIPAYTHSTGPINTNPSPNHLSPSPNHLSPSPNHLSSSPNHLSPSQNHISPSPNHLSPSPNHVSSSPNHVSPSQMISSPASNTSLLGSVPSANNAGSADAVLRSNLRPPTKVRRSDSLSKTEKTESNRRRQEKENVKLKRRHGAKDGAIKRRHTVGGTKDLATLPWLDNRWAPGEETKEGGRGLRTSSPDLGRVDWREWGVSGAEGKRPIGVLESHV